MSKSEFKRLCIQNPVGMAEQLHSLEQENAKLREELEIAKIQLKQAKESEECHAFNARAANNGYVEMDKRRIAAEQRAEAAEARIQEAETQKKLSNLLKELRG